MPRYFLLKINPGNCPKGNGRPDSPYDWEGGTFSVRRPPKSEYGGELAAFPVRGDQILIWVSETKGGAGLTALATVGLSQPEMDKLELTDIGIMPDQKLSNADLERDRPYIRRNQHEALHPFSPEKWRDVLEEARKKAGGKSVQRVEQNLPTDAQLAEWQVQRQKSLQLVENRPNQGPLRGALLKRDGECAVTGWTVVAVLEAAHLIPFASGHPERDIPENAVLLRSDIHTLMDKCLLAIDPRSHKIVLAPEIAATPYGVYAEQNAKTGAGYKYLLSCFELFKRARNS
jgi:hypothetical protein